MRKLLFEPFIGKYTLLDYLVGSLFPVIMFFVGLLIGARLF